MTGNDRDKLNKWNRDNFFILNHRQITSMSNIIDEIIDDHKPQTAAVEYSCCQFCGADIFKQAHHSTCELFNL